MIILSEHLGLMQCCSCQKSEQTIFSACCCVINGNHFNHTRSGVDIKVTGRNTCS